MKKVWLFGLLGLILLTGCQNTYCPPDEVEAVMDEMESLAEEWDDAIEIANSSSRMTLSGPIGDLQRIKRETGDLEVPECLTKAHENLEKSMQSGIDGFVAFMGQDSDEVVMDKFDLYSYFLDEYVEELNDISECLPNCKAP